MSKQSNSQISDKIRKLNELTDWFESDSFELEAALDKFAEAETLAKEIERDLAEFKNKIMVIKKDFSQD